MKAITSDPDIMAGAPCIRGTRIPVYMVLDSLAVRGQFDAVRRSFPQLTDKQIRAAITFAREVVEKRHL